MEAVAESVGCRATKAPVQPQKLTLVVFSGDLDKLLGALAIATTAAAGGAEVVLFFTFWGLLALRERRVARGKGLGERLLHLLLPTSARSTQLSRKGMFGLGTHFMRYLMRRKGVADVDALVEAAVALGVKLKVCEMSMDVMGFSREELIEGVEYTGAMSCVQDLLHSDSTLFV